MRSSFCSSRCIAGVLLAGLLLGSSSVYARRFHPLRNARNNLSVWWAYRGREFKAAQKGMTIGALSTLGLIGMAHPDAVRQVVDNPEQGLTAIGVGFAVSQAPRVLRMLPIKLGTVATVAAMGAGALILPESAVHNIATWFPFLDPATKQAVVETMMSFRNDMGSLALKATAGSMHAVSWTSAQAAHGLNFLAEKQDLMVPAFAGWLSGAVGNGLTRVIDRFSATPDAVKALDN